MKKQLITLALFLTILCSCEKSTVFSEYNKDFPENRWYSKDHKSFEFEIPASATPYKLTLMLSHVAGFQFATVPLELKLEHPDGKQETLSVNLELIDKDGQETGDCSGDYCDISQVVFTDRNLAAGTYKVSILNRFEHEYLPNILGVGIKVSSSFD